MHQDAIIQYVTDTFDGLDVLRPWDGPGAGDTFFYYDPEHNIDPSKRLPTDDATRSAAYDFAALDRFMPHPIYASQSWACVLNPSLETFETLKPLLAEAYSTQRAHVQRRHT